MGLKELLFHKKPKMTKAQLEAMQKKEREAYYKGYSRARIERARKRGLEAAKREAQFGGGIFGKIQRGALSVQEFIGGAEAGARGYMEMIGLDEGLFSEPTRRKKRKRKRKRKAKKSKTIVIKV